MKRLTFYLLLSLLLPLGVVAQDDEKPEAAQERDAPLLNRVFFGGNFSANIGNFNTFINVSPRVGYRITDQLSAGVGLTYMYWRTQNVFFGQPFNTSIYGGNLFSTFFITDRIFSHAEFEVLSVENFDPNLEERRTTVPGLFLGGGYAVPLGRRSSLNLMVLYNVLYRDRVASPYTSPIDVRVGFQL
ncbi:MAG: hypothetical protein ACFCUI_02815 [Bernardetiaceae bacterium]